MYRAVRIKKRVEAIIKDGRVISSPYYETEFSIKGTFIGWGLSVEEFTNGVGSYTVAMIELEDGTVTEISPYHIKFQDKSIK